MEVKIRTEADDEKKYEQEKNGGMKKYEKICGSSIYNFSYAIEQKYGEY